MTGRDGGSICHMPWNRRLIVDDPFARMDGNAKWNERGAWVARWVSHPLLDQPPAMFAFRCRFTLEAGVGAAVLHVTADERYELFLDGERVGRGPERGDVRHWFYETYEGELGAGEHVLVARVAVLGAMAPLAQMSGGEGGRGLLVAAEGPLHEAVSTGVASWEVRRIGGVEFVKERLAEAVGPVERVDAAAYPFGWEMGAGEGWEPVTPGPFGRSGSRWRDYGVPGHCLLPATLPPMLDEPRKLGRVRSVTAVGEGLVAVPFREADHLPEEAQRWQRLCEGGGEGGGGVTVPAGSRRRVLIDLEDYHCAYPEWVISGGKGARLRLAWAESTYEDVPGPTQYPVMSKGDRDQIEGKYFRGFGDTYLPDGGSGRRYETHWWRCGRYVQVEVQTRDEPVTLESLTFHETRYPLEAEGGFDCDDERINRILPIMWRTMQMCSHETYLDCPYYEQLMYVGDTRLEAVVHMNMSSDDRLPRKAVDAFAWSLTPEGITQSRYPSRGEQLIPPFSLWWVAMVYDAALWRGDRGFVASQMPAARSVLERFEAWRGEDGLIYPPVGWNFMDWAGPEGKQGGEGWVGGVPPGASAGEPVGASAMINWQWVLVLGHAAELEAWLGERELAARWERLADEAARATHAAFWNDARGLYADTRDADGNRDADHFSEHAQCLALLSGRMPQALQERCGRALFSDKDLTRTTIYFSHYLLETARLTGRIDRLFDRLGEWYELAEMGFRTAREAPEPSRSDCHAWAAHPIHHLLASVLGIRPSGLGFERVEITPQLGPLRRASGTMIHPRGPIRVDLKCGDDDHLTGKVVLPPGLSGWISIHGKQQPLQEGPTRL